MSNFEAFLGLILTTFLIMYCVAGAVSEPRDEKGRFTRVYKYSHKRAKPIRFYTDFKSEK